ncbi:MAG TPA: hypothetical protein VE568_17955 [Rubrobacter sp.]|nr:hypothetical protein [Rubrobacter sp.]
MSTMQVYLPWDTISFEVEIEHNFHLGDAWAVFRRRPQEGEANRPFPLTLNARQIKEVERIGETQIVSSVLFQVTVLERSNSIPGEYDLETIRGLEVDASEGAEGLDLGSPPDEVSFRIAAFPASPSCRVRRTSLGRKNPGSRYLRD